MTGYGRKTQLDGYVEGEFVDGKLHGFGLKVNIALFSLKFVIILSLCVTLQEYICGDRYEGDYQDDLKHGHGMYQWQDGSRYCGDWKDDCQHGFGEHWISKRLAIKLSSTK